MLCCWNVVIHRKGGDEEMERTQYIPVGMGWEL